jgi:hypothetical protein
MVAVTVVLGALVMSALAPASEQQPAATRVGGDDPGRCVRVGVGGRFSARACARSGTSDIPGNASLTV